MTEAAAILAIAIAAALGAANASDDTLLMARAVGWETLGAPQDRQYVASVIRWRML